MIRPLSVILFVFTLSCTIFPTGQILQAATTETTASHESLSDNKTITSDEVLTYVDGRYHLDGKPFAEISFNLFDLFWVLFDSACKGEPLDETNPSYVEKERSLKELHEMGFRTIRIFGHPFSQAQFRGMYDDPTKREKYYEAVDAAISLAEKYNIGIVWSLGVSNFCDDGSNLTKEEGSLADLMGNPNSERRAYLNHVLEDVIPRYKDRKGIVMWELANEMTLEIDIPHYQNPATLAQLAVFMDDVSKKIKSLDPLRMVSSGGSALREYAWGLYHKKGWSKIDNLAEQTKAYEVLYKNSACDVFDIHCYSIWGCEIFGDDTNTEKIRLTAREFKELADAMNKPFMVGEFGALPNDKEMRAQAQARGETYFEKLEDPESKPFVQIMLDQMIEGDIQLAYYWAYRTEHPQQRGVLDITPERTPVALQQIVEANQKLKKKWNVPLKTQAP